MDLSYSPRYEAFRREVLGAIDLRLRRMEVRDWFDGVPIYFTNSDAVYPPASYLLLWPFARWESLAVLRRRDGVPVQREVLLIHCCSLTLTQSAGLRRTARR